METRSEENVHKLRLRLSDSVSRKFVATLKNIYFSSLIECIANNENKCRKTET